MKSLWRLICLLLVIVVAVSACAVEPPNRAEYWQQVFERDGRADAFKAILDNMDETRFEGENVADLVAAADAIALKRAQIFNRKPIAADFEVASDVLTAAPGCIPAKHMEWKPYRPAIIQNADSDPSVHQEIARRVSDDLLQKSCLAIKEIVEASPLDEYVELTLS